MEEGSYYVQKILKKRIIQGKVDYHLKWKCYRAEKNSWQPVKNLDCEELIQKFEDRLNKEQQQKEAAKCKPSIPTLSKSTNASRGNVKKINVTPQKTKKAKTVEKVPVRIVGATETRGQLMFLFQWEGLEETEVVPATIANQKYPKTVIDFYQQRLTFNDTNVNN